MRHDCYYRKEHETQPQQADKPLGTPVMIEIMNTGPVLVDVAVKDLSGPPLNWAVFCAVYSGMQPTIHIIEAGTHEMRGFMKPINFPRAVSLTYSGAYGVECNWSPSGDWDDGGPLIAAHQVSLHCPQSTDDVWAGWIITDKGEFCQGGKTPLIAACRAIVASKLGDIVKVPAYLVMP